MLSVLLIWLFIWFTTVPLGYCCIRVLRQFCGMPSDPDDRISMLSFSMAGLAAAAVYAQYFSLLHRVSAFAVILLSLAAALLWYRYGKKILTECRESSAGHGSDGKKGSRIVRYLLYGAFIAILALVTSRGFMHYDSNLYHAQSIRWIEEYGAVKGLANLHNRLGYNSAAFPLTALYSFSFAGGQSYHAVGGYLLLLTLTECLKVLRLLRPSSLRDPQLRVSDFIRIAGIYYCFNCMKEIVSPASDPFMVLIALYVVIRYSELPEADRGYFYAALLSMLVVFNITVKLSSAGMILLAFFPLAGYLRKKQWRPVTAFILTGILIALPFFLRNIILTGYLVYPFPSVDLFQVPWKVPAGAALADAKEIKAWGRGFPDLTMADAPIMAWFPAWFAALRGLDKAFFILSAVSIPVLTGFFMIEYKSFRATDKAITVTIAAALYTSLVFWFRSAPLIRYGYIFCYLPVLFTVGCIQCLPEENPGKSFGRKTGRNSDWRIFADRRVTGRLAVCMIGLLLLWKCTGMVREQSAWSGGEYLIRQQDYDSYQADSYEIDGVTFYYPVQGDQCGYSVFPSAPTERKELTLLVPGRIEGGFKVSAGSEQ